MSRKYIPQRDSLDFVYPNNFTAEYDLEIIHDINDNCVSGNVTVFSATTINLTGITFNIQGDWSLNSAEPYVDIDGGFLSVASIHMMGPTQSYYRPWRLVHNIVSTGLTNTYISINENFTVLPSDLGLTGFTSGTYYSEVRMIGKKCVYPICVTLPITVSPPPTSTPTPTPTNTATPTPTPSACLNNVQINVISETADIQYTRCCGEIATLFFPTTGINTIFDCMLNGSFITLSGTAFQQGGSGTACNCPTPTPTPTPTVAPVGQCYCFPIVVTGTTIPGPEGGTIATLQYNDCFGVLTARSFTTGPGTYYQCIQVISSVVQYDPVGTTGIDQSYLTLTYLTGNCNTGYVCSGYVPSGSTPTPTPTVTSTPTPTPTPTSGGEKSIELRVRDIASIPQTITMFYNVNGGSNINIPGGTSVTFPITCTVLYTISGLTTGDVVVFGTSSACAMEGAGGTGCPGFVGSLTTYSYVVDAPSIQTLSLTIDTQTIP
jgi:hypothetical protein